MTQSGPYVVPAWSSHRLERREKKSVDPEVEQGNVQLRSSREGLEQQNE